MLGLIFHDGIEVGVGRRQQDGRWCALVSVILLPGRDAHVLYAVSELPGNAWQEDLATLMGNHHVELFGPLPGWPAIALPPKLRVDYWYKSAPDFADPGVRLESWGTFLSIEILDLAEWTARGARIR